MYFFFKQKKQYLDLTGNLILNHNDNLVKARIKSAAPSKINNATFVELSGLNPIWKIKATFAAIGFIWGKNKALKQEDTDYRESHRANQANSINDDRDETKSAHTCYLGDGKECRSTCPECTKKAI